MRCAAARQHEGNDGAGGGEQRADAGGIGVGVVIVALHAHAGEEAEPPDTTASVVMTARPNSTSAARLRATSATANAAMT